MDTDRITDEWELPITDWLIEYRTVSWWVTNLLTATRLVTWLVVVVLVVLVLVLVVLVLLLLTTSTSNSS